MHPMPKMKTARFWHYSACGEAILIKIKAGETLRHYHGGSTDEGWSSESNMWSFDGWTLMTSWISDGCDCDGRLRREGQSHCPAYDLKAGYLDEDGTRFPKWQHDRSIQRDYSAEAMGY